VIGRPDGEAGSLEVRGVGRSFTTDRGTVVALDHVDLYAQPGEFVSLIGPSGCGKSTLFSILAGLLEPSSGEVRIGGRLVGDLLGEAAYMPQDDALLPWLRVIDNATLSLRLAGVTRREARKRALPLLERFGLGAFSESWPGELSGGMRQRAAFLRTVIMERSVMLLDEPFGALDGITRADLQQWLLDVWEEVRTTVLFITHDVAEAVFLSDRVYVMSPRPGRIAAVVRCDLPRPRTLAIEEDEQFVLLERHLRHELRAATAGRGSVDPTGAAP
jgi:ABC-type nitrate/sulfonate/bicarbonate transport system ATPase subunit